MTRLHHIRMELARDADAPDGDPDVGYDLVLPLDDNRRLAGAEAFANQPQAGRVRRFRDGETEAIGQLKHGPGGVWRLEFEGEPRPEVAFRLGEEQFQPGEYVAIREADGDYHPYRIVSTRELD
ncbi:MAG: hypothetical protein ACK5QD_13135 [Brevundimonas sp.]|uniref:hypothetical protein n=2 Tax=Brevundimonas sp. TaxID=1871086 RepID=UPI0022CC5133|nr:hypothetical protein [Brevundimonas sp.]MCZ8195233.1 hypothetical protein [Brevundimonas sp.]